MEKKNFTFFQYVWIFIVSCYAGFILETVWCLIKNGYIESRKSLVLGHLSVAYGMGALLLTFLLVNFQNAKTWKIFLIAFVSGTATEYICSLGQELLFGTVAWDYSNLPLNINGRVCLLYSIFWGLLGVFWAKVMIPFMRWAFSRIHLPFEKVLVWAFLAFFVFDCALSASAALRMNERAAGVAPSNKIEQLLDTYYPDEKIEKIYANSKPAE